MQGQKTGVENHNDILIWRTLAIVCMRVRVICSVQLTSCLISTQNHRQRSPFDLFTAQYWCSTLGWLVYTRTRADTHLWKLIERHASSEQKNESNTVLSWKHTKSSVCTLGQLHWVSSIFKHVYLLIQNQRWGPSFFVTKMYSAIFLSLSKTPLSLSINGQLTLP